MPSPPKLPHHDGRRAIQPDGRRRPGEPAKAIRAGSGLRLAQFSDDEAGAAALWEPGYDPKDLGGRTLTRISRDKKIRTP